MPTARMTVLPSITACTVALAATMASSGQVQFTEAGAPRGIGTYVPPGGYCGGGAAAADVDGDGWVDFHVSNGFGAPDQVYRNLGNGSFEEVAASFGLDSTENSRAALWFDFDGDADLDLVVARDAYGNPDFTPPTVLALYRQDPDGTFADVTAGSGLTTATLPSIETHIGGLAAGDLNRDGYLDLLVTQWRGFTRVYFNNAGDGTFTDVTGPQGLSGDVGTAWQPAIQDFNQDGWPDIYVAIDFLPNELWLNLQDGTFVNAAEPAGVATAYNEMGTTLGDYDNDGDLDIYSTCISRPDGTPPGKHSVLFRNDSEPGIARFVEVASDLGIQHIFWGWGVTFLDANRDRWLDLAVTNGFWAEEWQTDPSRFFLSAGAAPAAFTEVSAAIGFDDTEFGNALVAADTDRDGDLDLIQTCNLDGGVRLLESSDTTTNGGYLVVRPRQAGPNHFAVGAIVRATMNGMTVIRPITAGTSFLGQEPAEAFFGVGDATIVDAVTVEWPDGGTTTIDDVPAGQVITIDRPAAPCPGDVDDSDDVGFGDLLALLAAWGPCAACPEDLDGDDTVAFADLLLVVSAWGACP